MIPWLVLAAAALIYPALGRVISARARGGAARLLFLLWLAGSLALWGELAARSGQAGGHWNQSVVLLVLLGGLAYLELLSLLPGVRRASRPRGEDGSPDDEAAAGAEEEAIRLPTTARREESDRPDRTPRREPSQEKLPPEAQALLERIQRLDKVPCSSIMVPRERIVFADVSETAREALARMRGAGAGRIPVVAGGSLDRILGIVHAKDLVPLVLEEEGEATLRRNQRRWLRVTADKPVARLLEDFRRNRVHLGIVSDPLGRTLGLVTLGDVFNYLAGARQREQAAGPPPGDAP